ncbi:MAG TPA: DUF2203 domain-containing protein [Acidimicrobiia bacterium]|nr:DUF2203 domain-containing protein [Acidimicrobiia bacterium]
MDRVFTVTEADALGPEVARLMAELAPIAARAAEAASTRTALAKSNGHGPRVEGGAELRAGLAWFEARGIQVKGFSPPLVDFPAGSGVLLCWIEGEDRITHWHRESDGFAGRRPLSELP